MSVDGAKILKVLCWFGEKLRTIIGKSLRGLGDFLAMFWAGILLFAFFFGVVAIAVKLGMDTDKRVERERQEAVKREMFCYERGYHEVVNIKHAPYYMCLDARRSSDGSVAAELIPEHIWNPHKVSNERIME